jgi:DNA end-binding protein Ku
MSRALWKGAISFGLVYIPVELYSAVQEHQLDLTMLDRRDFSPIGFKRYNKKTGKEVAWDNIVKGYEYQDNEYVVLSDEDLRRANPEANQTIAIEAFVDAADVPLTYYETPYYLAPVRGGAKVYALLRETLRRAGKIGIATVVMRTKQHLCALVCIDDKIVLNTLRYADELRGTEELKLPANTLKAAGISDKEMQMALALVEGMSDDWQPDRYRDNYREDVLALVKKKIKAGQTKTITAPSAQPRAARSSNVVDLVALLQSSLGKRPGTATRRITAAADVADNADDADDAVDSGTVTTRPAGKSTRARTAAKPTAAKPATKKAAAAPAASKKAPAKATPPPRRATSATRAKAA